MAAFEYDITKMSTAHILLIEDTLTAYAQAVADQEHDGVWIRGRLLNWQRADRLLRWATRHIIVKTNTTSTFAKS